MPRVFAPAAFRYPPQTGKDYPYGWQDIGDDSLVRTLIAAGYLQDGGAGPDPWVGTPAGSAAVAAAVNLQFRLTQAHARQRSRPYRTTFYTRPQAWQASTVYAAGQAILAGGNWYHCLVGGTSGASAPTWTTTPQTVSPYMAITDGTCQWVYYGPDVAPYAGDTTVSVAFSATRNAETATTYNEYIPVTGSWGSPTGTALDSNANATKQFVPTGGGTTAAIASWVGDLMKSPNAASVFVKQTNGGALGLCCSHGNSKSNASIVSLPYWEFETESSVIEFATSQYDSGLSAQGGVQVWVDDVEYEVGAQVAPSSVTGTLGNNNLYTQIVINGPVRRRNIRVRGVTGIRGLRVVANCSLYPGKEQAVKILAIGDSLSAGSGQGPARPGAQMPNVLAQEMGIRVGCTNASTGSTGIEVSTGGYTYLQRITESGRADYLPNNSVAYSTQCNVYDLILVELPNGNDSPTSPTLQVNTVAFLRALRALQPTAKIVIFGGWSGSNEANADAFDQVAQAAFAAWGDANASYISTRNVAGATFKSAGGAWSQGSGYCASGHTAATGNSSLLCGADGVHYNDAGINLFGSKGAQAVQALLGVS